MILRNAANPRNSCLLALLLALPAPCVLAQTPQTLPAWDQLSPAQREQLIAPLRERWNSQPQARPRLLRNAQRWQQFDPQQRERAQRGLRRLEQMNPKQRRQARALYQRLQQLPEAERRAVRERLRTMTPEQRRAWMQQNANAAPSPKP
ncbi:MAG: DUF3106 domain-containing protein [Gammaproteobacteria bacterium]|nr:DUF3106 domain-containing protein [Gammaproteobacteria bacterium]